MRKRKNKRRGAAAIIAPLLQLLRPPVSKPAARPPAPPCRTCMGTGTAAALDEQGRAVVCSSCLGSGTRGRLSKSR